MKIKSVNLLYGMAAVLCLAACDRTEPTSIQATSLAVTAAEPASGALALVGGTLIDGSLSTPIGNSVILIRDGIIESVGTLNELAIPADYEQISTEGMTVMPGLWDLHVHLLYAGHTNNPYWHEVYTSRFEADIMPATAMQQLQSGVTSVRDLGAPAESVFNLREKIAGGTLSGPGIYAAGPQINRSFPDWARFYRTPVANPEAAAATANALIDSGADILKITNAEAMAVADIRAITDVAHARGIRVTAHGRTDREILMGLEGGVDEFQHIGVTAGSPEYPLEVMDAIRSRVAAGPALYWTPTVGLQLRSAYLAANPEMLDAPANYAGLPEDVIADIKASLSDFAPVPADADSIVRKVTQLRDAGVELLVGTDAGLAGNFHSQAMWQEMDSWVSILGFDALETIHRATSVAARYMGRQDEAGMVAVGQIADVIAVEGDPTRDMSVLSQPSIVIVGGSRIK